MKVMLISLLLLAPGCEYEVKKQLPASILAPGPPLEHIQSAPGVESPDFVLFWDGELLLHDTLFVFRANPVQRTSTRYAIVNNSVVCVDLFRKERDRSADFYRTRTYKQHLYP